MNIIDVQLVSGSDAFTHIDWDQAAKDHEYKPWIMDEDPLALSWCSWRIGQETQSSRPSLDGCNPTARDRDMAQRMRRYYSDSIGLSMLRAQPISRFRRDLYELLIGGPCQIRHQGMVWRLPEFYHEDQMRARVRDRFQAVDINWDRYGRVGEFDLRAVERFTALRRHRKTVHFWFQDQWGTPVQWLVDAQNDLIGMVQCIWESARPVKIAAHGSRVTSWVDQDQWRHVRISRARILAL